MGMIVKQPNGLYCRISTIVDAPTHTNMSKEELRMYLIGSNQLDGLKITEWLGRYAKTWEEAKNVINTNNLTEKEIEEWLTEVST